MPAIVGEKGYAGERAFTRERWKWWRWRSGRRALQVSCRFMMRWLHLPCVRKPALLYVPALSLHGLRGGIIVDIVRGNEESDA